LLVKMIRVPSGVSRHRVARAVEGELPGLAARRRNHPDVVVPQAIAGERDPLAVGRETRERVPGDVCGEPYRARAVRVRDPQVAVVGEDELSARDVGVAGEFDRRGDHRGGDDDQADGRDDCGPDGW
jgi:hypothetical protein